MGLRDFKARTGTLTLLFLTSTQNPAVLLRLLADATVEEKNRVIDPDALPDVDAEDEADALELVAEEDFEEDDADEESPEEDEEERGEDFDPAAPYALAEPPPEHGEAFDPDAKMTATPAGMEALFVATALEGWLRSSPSGPLRIGGEGTGPAIAGLVFSWGVGVVHALAGRPLALPELNAALPAIPYRAIEEQIDAMELAGLVEAVTDAEGCTRYAATEWLREGIAPLAASARLESHHPPGEAAPPEGIDAEAAFRLALPLLELPPEVAGTCRLTADLGGGELARVTARIEAGRVTSCSTDLDGEVDAWATASPVDWLDTLFEPTVARVELGGDEQLAASVLAGLHERLLGRGGPA